MYRFLSTCNWIFIPGSPSLIGRLIFLQQILNYSQVAESGREFVKRLSNLTIQSTLFVPANDGLYVNQVRYTENVFDRSI